MDNPPPTAWERQRAALRAEIVSAARELFVTRGFEATTVDDIAGAVGVSRRSFFRYFGTKEDVLLTDLVAQGESVARALEDRPADEGAWTALLRAMAAARDASPFTADADLAIGRMMFQIPSLRARHLEKRLRWQELLVPPVERRIHDDDPHLRASAIVITVLSCLDSATEAFVLADGETALEELFLTALDAATLSAPAGLLADLSADRRAQPDRLRYS